jgi:Mg2+ and Co2+ transporter CorA
MSDLMTHGVLRMPPDMWRDDPLDIAQRHSRYVAASDRIYELERELAETKRLLVEANKWLDKFRTEQQYTKSGAMRKYDYVDERLYQLLSRIDAAIKEQSHD